MSESREVERYVAGTLSAEEAARFEEALIAHPELAAEVSVRRRIRAGLSELEKNKELEAFLKPEVQRPPYIRYAAAAAVLVVLAAGIMTFWNRDGASPLQAFLPPSEVGTQSIVSSFILATTRSANVLAFEVQRDGGPVRLQILVDDATAAPFAVQLLAGDDHPPWLQFKESSISQTEDGFAVVYLDPRELDSGSYTLSLKSKSSAEQLFPFALIVTPQRKTAPD